MAHPAKRFSSVAEGVLPGQTADGQDVKKDDLRFGVDAGRMCNGDEVAPKIGVVDRH